MSVVATSDSHSLNLKSKLESKQQSKTQKQVSRLNVIFSTFCRLRSPDSMNGYHCTLAFEPDFLSEQRSTLNSGCPS